MLTGRAAGFLFPCHAFAPTVSGGYLVIQWLPETKRSSKKGQDTVPKGQEPFTHKQYRTVADTLPSSGFTDVKCVNLHDLNLLAAQVNSEKIHQITVNGSPIPLSRKMYTPDVPIVITDHGR